MRAAPPALAAALALVLAPAAAAAPPPPLPEAERLLLAEALRLSEELGEEIWSGWSTAPWEVVLVTAEHEYLVNSPRRPEGFVSLGREARLEREVQVRTRTVAPDLRATFPLLGPPAAVVIGRLEATGLDPTSWITILLHEHFHQLQMSDPGYYEEVAALDLARGDATGQWMLDFPFPYDDPRVGRRFDELAVAVLAALDGRAPAAWVGEAMAALAVSVPADATRYLGFQLWQEGVARFVQLRTAQLAAERFRPSPELAALPGYRPFAELAAELEAAIRAELAAPRLAERRRIAFYAVGAGLAMLLDRQTPGWRQRYLDEKFALEGFLGR